MQDVVSHESGFSLEKVGQVTMRFISAQDQNSDSNVTYIQLFQIIHYHLWLFKDIRMLKQNEK